MRRGDVDAGGPGSQRHGSLSVGRLPEWANQRLAPSMTRRVHVDVTWSELPVEEVRVELPADVYYLSRVPVDIRALDVRSSVGAPITVADEVWGVLVATNGGWPVNIW